VKSHRRVFFDRKRTKYKDQLTAKEWQDLIDFEGNANGFSVLTASRPGIEGGLRISYATLVLYEISKRVYLKNQPKNIADKKIWFFSNRQSFEEVAKIWV
jgi:dGTPase